MKILNNIRYIKHSNVYGCDLKNNLVYIPIISNYNNNLDFFRNRLLPNILKFYNELHQHTHRNQVCSLSRSNIIIDQLFLFTGYDSNCRGSICAHCIFKANRLQQLTYPQLLQLVKELAILNKHKPSNKIDILNENNLE